MKQELEEKLIAQYPSLFRDKDKPETESLMCFGCECGDGWYGIIDAVCAVITGHAKQNSKTADFRWTQIKEKFGALRLYHFGGADDYIVGALQMAESLSSRTCETCGKPGTRRGGGWVVTLCDDCA
jgi:hypothetical protein